MPQQSVPVGHFFQDDIAEVANLNWKYLRGRNGGAPDALKSFLNELYFENPWIDGTIPSLVYADGGKVVGFLGVIPRRMSVCDESIRVALGVIS